VVTPKVESNHHRLVSLVPYLKLGRTFVAVECGSINIVFLAMHISRVPHNTDGIYHRSSPGDTGTAARGKMRQRLDPRPLPPRRTKSAESGFAIFALKRFLRMGGFMHIHGLAFFGIYSFFSWKKI